MKQTIQPLAVHRTSELALSLKILIPAALMFLLFIFFSYFVVLPFVENHLMDQKRLMLRSMSASAWSLLNHYHEEAVSERLTDEEAQTRALNALRNLRFNSKGKDYFWVSDRSVIIRMHPFQQELEGRSLSGYLDASGRRIFFDMVTDAKQSGEDFIDYLTQWPDDPLPTVPTLSFVKLYKPWGWVMGISMNLEDVHDEIAVLNGKLLWLLAVVLVVAIAFGFYIYQQASTVESGRRRAEKINGVLIWISNAVNTTFELDALYHSIHQSLGAIVDVSNFCIAIYDREKNTISFPYYQDEVDKDVPVIEDINRSGSLTARVIRSAEPLLSTREQTIAWAASQGYPTVGTPAELWFGVPLKIKNQVIGAMVTQSYTRADHFDDTDLDVFMSVSDQVAIAIERKQHEMRDSSERKTAELQLKQKRDALEVSVQERTDALVKINAQLESEIRRHEGTERVLMESEEKHRTLVENIPDVIYSTDDQGNIVTMNNPSENFFGYRSEEVLGHRFASLLHPEDRKLAVDIFEAGIEQRVDLTKGLQGRLIAKDGRTHWVEVNLRRQFDTKGKFVRIDGVLRDVSHTKMLQEKLIQSERLAASGQLAASIAHEINSPLQGVTSLLNVIRKEYGGDSNLIDHLDLIKGAFNSIRNTVKNLLDLNRPGKEKNQPMRIQEILNLTGALVKSYLKDNGVLLHMDLPPDLPVIMGSPQQLGQVYMNLINNAVESMTAGSAAEDRRITIRAVAETDQIAVHVGDTGIGISDEDMSHIFDAFFTRKKKMGMGVGLSICHRIIEDHNGTISVRNLPEGGAEFTVRLPVAGSETAQVG